MLTKVKRVRVDHVATLVARNAKSIPQWKQGPATLPCFGSYATMSGEALMFLIEAAMTVLEAV
jgi:hypothetical protein